MTEPEREPDPIAALLHRAVELTEPERLLARNQFLGRVDREPKRTTTSHRLIRYAAPLALAASLLLVWHFSRPQRGLEYTVHGAVRNGDYVQVAADHAANIVFSDHTRIVAAAGVRMRIDEAGQNGARIAIERGRLEVEVTHTEGRSWRFEAGPFKVRVTGTRFVLAWDPNQEQIEVVLDAGSVDIDGYTGSGLVSVHAGQRFLGDARRRTMLVTDITGPLEPSRPRESAVPGPVASTSASPIPSVGGTPPPAQSSPTPGSPTPNRKVTWSDLVSKGAFRQVVDEATARGASSCLASCGAEDLSALADASRYVGRGDLAEGALLALRTRHASAYGVRAAFLLGRLHESKGSMARAKSWYETALQEGSAGGFAAEALAGRMRAVNAVEGRTAARAVARDYLRLYPNGVHAAMARQLAEGP